VIVIRTLPTGGQVKIDVDIQRALDDPRERVVIQQNDLVLLKYRPWELGLNLALNIFNLNLTGSGSIYKGTVVSSPIVGNQ
jgi:hypothetical protein